MVLQGGEMLLESCCINRRVKEIKIVGLLNTLGFGGSLGFSDKERDS